MFSGSPFSASNIRQNVISKKTSTYTVKIHLQSPNIFFKGILSSSFPRDHHLPLFSRSRRGPWLGCLMRSWFSCIPWSRAARLFAATNGFYGQACSQHPRQGIKGDKANQVERSNDPFTSIYHIYPPSGSDLPLLGRDLVEAASTIIPMMVVGWLQHSQWGWFIPSPGKNPQLAKKWDPKAGRFFGGHKDIPSHMISSSIRRCNPGPNPSSNEPGTAN